MRLPSFVFALEVGDLGMLEDEGCLTISVAVLSIVCRCCRLLRLGNREVIGEFELMFPSEPFEEFIASIVGVFGALNRRCILPKKFLLLVETPVDDNPSS